MRWYRFRAWMWLRNWAYRIYANYDGLGIVTWESAQSGKHTWAHEPGIERYLHSEPNPCLYCASRARSAWKVSCPSHRGIFADIHFEMYLCKIADVECHLLPYWYMANLEVVPAEMSTRVGIDTHE
jgi:hypothetical protein